MKYSFILIGFYILITVFYLCNPLKMLFCSKSNHYLSAAYTENLLSFLTTNQQNQGVPDIFLVFHLFQSLDSFTEHWSVNSFTNVPSFLFLLPSMWFYTVCQFEQQIMQYLSK